MTKPTTAAIVETVLERHGRTFAAEAGARIELNTPAPLFRLLCLALLVSARISSQVAMSAAKALVKAGWTTPAKLSGSTWEQRTTVLNRSGYARYDESTARYLQRSTDLLVERYGGDLRRLRDESGGDVSELSERLIQFTGIGTVGAEFFLREVQAVWPEVMPFVDGHVSDGAEMLGLPTEAPALRKLVEDDAAFARLAAALVRVRLADDAEGLLERAAQR